MRRIYALASRSDRGLEPVGLDPGRDRRRQGGGGRGAPRPVEGGAPGPIVRSAARRCPRTCSRRAVRPRARRVPRRATGGKLGLLSRPPPAARSSSTRSARMAPALQAKMLRVLERKVITRVGGTDGIGGRADASRRLTATPGRGARRAWFRADLYFRLAGFTLAVPPLRDRVEEIVRSRSTRQARRRGARPARAAALRGRPARAPQPRLARQRPRAAQRARARRRGADQRPISAEDLPERVLDAGRRAPAPARRLDPRSPARSAGRSRARGDRPRRSSSSAATRPAPRSGSASRGAR